MDKGIHFGHYAPVRTPLRFLLTSALFVTASAVAAAGCGDARKEHAVDVTESCNRLADLAGVVLSLRSATTAQEVQTAIETPLAAFVAAADRSGDKRLADLAHTYDSRFSAYLEGDASDAGNDANVALDRAGARCIELGAADDFPRNS
jgi:hypothetical protein